MFEAELSRYNSIIEERTAARIELDRVLMKGHVPERYEAVKKYVAAIDQCLEQLHAWNDDMAAKIARIYQDGIGIPSASDPTWVLMRNSHAQTWLTSLRTEKHELERWLSAANDMEGGKK